MVLAYVWYGRQYDLLSFSAMYMRLYHNPRCSKSRQAVALLNQHEIDFEEYLYLDTGIDNDDLNILVDLDGIIRVSDINDKSEYDLSKKSEIQRLLKNEPKTLQRPILVHDGRAVIGRPPENILTLLHGL